MSVVKKIKDGAGTEYDIGVEASNVSGTLPIANGGTGATTTKVAQYNLLGDMVSATSDISDTTCFAGAYITPSTANGALYKNTFAKVWNYIKSKLGSSSGKGSTKVPIYFDSNGVAQTCDNWKQGCLIDTHSEGNGTCMIDGLNELYAFYTRGGTCTAYEYDLTWDASNPPATNLFTAEDLSEYKTTTSVSSISEKVFNSLTGYNQSGVYSGTKFAVYDLTLPITYCYTSTFTWSFGYSGWKPAFMQILSANASGDFISKYRSTDCPAFGKTYVQTTASSNATRRIRIVVSKYSRLSAFGFQNYSSIGLSTNYLSRTVDQGLYRNISVAVDNTYDLGSSSAKWANVYATNFVGNASTATTATTATNVTSASKCSSYTEMSFSGVSLDDFKGSGDNSLYKKLPFQHGDVSYSCHGWGRLWGMSSDILSYLGLVSNYGLVEWFQARDQYHVIVYDVRTSGKFKHVWLSTSGITRVGGTLGADLIGNVTGNVTGNLTGNVTGDVTGNAETATTATTATDYSATGGIATALAGKQATLTQGTNITISGNVISATDTTYSEPNDTVLQDIVDSLS